MTQNQPFTLEQKVQAQAYGMLFNPGVVVELSNSGIKEPIDNGTPAPKFAIGQEILFTGNPRTADKYTGFGKIVAISYYLEEIFYSVQISGAMIGSTPATIEWLKEYEGNMVQVLETDVDRPAPKFHPNQSVVFQLTFTVSAVVDGEAQWIEDDKEYLYSVKDAQLLENPANIYLSKADLEVDTENSMFLEKQLFTHCKLGSKGRLIPDLPSCEFNPD